MTRPECAAATCTTLVNVMAGEFLEAQRAVTQQDKVNTEFLDPRISSLTQLPCYDCRRLPKHRYLLRRDVVRRSH